MSCGAPRCRYLRPIRATYDREFVDCRHKVYRALRGRGHCVLKDLIVFNEQVGCDAYVPERGAKYVR